MKTSLVLVAVLCTATTFAQVADNLTQNLCPSSTTCNECIQSPACAWCIDPNFGDKSRCFQPPRPSSSLYCRDEYTWDPANYYHVVMSKELSRAHSASDGNISSNSSSSSSEESSASETVHIAPQHIQIKFRPNDVPYKFKLFYTQVEDYPVDLVQNSSSVELKDTARDGIKINYYSNCLDLFGELIQTNNCSNMKAGDVVVFDVEIEELPACAADHKNWRQTIQIYPVGINESLTVDLELSCSCPCENPGDVNYIENAAECNGNGTSKCGICECNPGFSGKRCGCADAAGIDYTQNCRPNNETVECSGRGNCTCGVCECFAQENRDEVISGEFCECDNFSCDRHNGQLCSGPENGVCVCGKCQCNSPWTGSDCSCRASNDTCFYPNTGNTEVCSGHGECVCGRCQCQKTDYVRYSGKYCEKCPTCADRCFEFKDCVQCLMHKTGPYSEENCSSNCTFVPIAVPKIEGMKTSLVLVAVLCTATTIAQVAENLTQNLCPSRTTCNECIQSPACAWCIDPNFGDKSRCFQPPRPSSSLYCRDEYTWDPANYYHVVMSKELSRAHSASDGNISSNSSSSSSQESSASETVHIAPQHIQIKFRPNDVPYKFKLFYTQVEDYPVDLVQNSSSVELKDTARDGIKINYYSNCLDLFGELIQTNNCSNMKAGDVVVFDVEIEELPACAADHKNWRQTIQIYPVGINESLTVDLELSCSCPCENPGDVNYIENAAECNGNGTSKCGICECNPGFSGKRCGCADAAGIDYTQNCRPNNETVECSGRGNCTCGVCECFAQENRDEVISGTFCEYDNFSCDRHNGQLCSGPENGVCVCGKCQCNSPWTGSDCSCRASNDTCFYPNTENTEVCSGHGECVCGRCQCQKTDYVRYSGKYCEKCPTCVDRCFEFKDCVQCLMHKTGPYSEENCSSNCTFVPIAVPKIEVDVEKDESLCAFYDEDDCRFDFSYSFTENDTLVIKAQNERKCPPRYGFSLFN